MINCPECGSENIRWDFACHTYGSGDKFFACMPCDSAFKILCVECHWSYTWGLNPNNPRSKINELRRPSWLPAGMPDMEKSFPLDIKVIWRD